MLSPCRRRQKVRDVQWNVGSPNITLLGGLLVMVTGKIMYGKITYAKCLMLNRVLGTI